MSKLFKYVSIILVAFFMLSKCATANSYNETLLGHILQTNLDGDKPDLNYLLENELKRNAHKYALDTIIILEKYLPQIIEGLTAKMRQDADRVYKESLLEGSTIND